MILLVFTPLALAVGTQPQALDVAGVYKIAGIDPNLTGEGISIGLVCRSDTYIDSKPQNDYRPDISHKCFENSSVDFYDDNAVAPGVSNHSTAIASILIGSDPNASYPSLGNFSYKSAAPDAKLNVYEFWNFIVDYVFPAHWPKEDFITMSLGWSCEAWWTRGIDNIADSFGLLIIASIGNGKNAYDLPLYPAAGANVLAVGVADSNGSLADFNAPDANRSTAGPTIDGRCKPDIVAPGNCLVAIADSNPDASGYRPSGDYSSFAAPVAAGVASMLIQKAKTDPNLQLAASSFAGNCVMKSILMTGAEKLTGWHKGYPDSNDDSEYPLDFRQGAGMLDGLAAYNILTAGMQPRLIGDVKTAGWDINIIEPNYIADKIYRFQTAANPDASGLTATLVWNRNYQDQYPFNLNSELWTDLQLQLRTIDEDGRINPIDYSDSPVDNVEHLYVPLDPNTTYELVVSHSLNSQLPKGFAVYALSWQISE
ncbi:MAG: S8 family serine peptidase [Planctomycetes bacterium]|nr:S8 family serine peptidase [Planctomycetota bacterium]MBU1518612.1 S8 family serine peptidase [Planctomycetota bacterium]